MRKTVENSACNPTVTTPAYGAALFLALGVSGIVKADQQILDDLIVDGSACIGQDCVNGESFGFDTIRLKENNLRIKFQDTSSSASFPTTDWQLTANDSSNGGANRFSIDDIDSGRTPFTIEAGAPSHSLYVDDGGRIGLGTSTPVVEMHVADGDTPTMRLEQNGSSGFTPQTWDVAGNETNFFVRDVTNGSALPFRIRSGAPTSAIDIAADGDVGLNTTSPAANLHVKSDDASWADSPDVLLESTQDVALNLRLLSGTTPILQLQNTGGSGVNDRWNISLRADGSLRFSNPMTTVRALELLPNGDVRIGGNLVVTGTVTSAP